MSYDVGLPRFILFVPLADNTGPNETFGYNFPGANYTTPTYPENVSYPPILPTGWPTGYATLCPLCYNASTPTKNSSRL